MSGKKIRTLVVLATISILGIIGTQVYWFKKAFDVEQDQFNRDVNIALFNVANQLFEISKTALPANNPIKQLSTNYYVVMINNEIDANLLEYLLKTEFEKRNIAADFEYGIYDCTNEKMVYGNYVSMTKLDQIHSRAGSLPKWENQSYYFGVQFANKTATITNRMGIWMFSSSVLLIVIIFFSYAMFVILKQKRLSEIQKDFINNMTHEFKTPISTISLSVDVLKNPKIIDQPERLRNYTSIIETENQRLKNQVERVLQMASLDKEEIGLKLESTDLHRLTEEAVEDIVMGLNERNGIVDFELKAENYMIECDRLHLTNVIHNLLDNAIKYSKSDPQITIKTISSNGKLILSIQDNGIGIADNDKKKIFDKFYRVPTGNIHDVKGFGLGLNYVNLIVKAHKGNIELNSEEGKGTTFIITFKNGKNSTS